MLGQGVTGNLLCAAARFAVALPVTADLREAGLLRVHQALRVLRKTRPCPEEVEVLEVGGA